jgi:hypothetical protein
MAGDAAGKQEANSDCQRLSAFSHQGPALSRLDLVLMIEMRSNSIREAIGFSRWNLVWDMNYQPILCLRDVLRGMDNKALYPFVEFAASDWRRIERVK